MKIHLDSDFGGDTDDACALAMLLGWPGVELVGVTTSADRTGLRAAYVQHVVSLVRRDEVPVASGAAASLTTLDTADPVTDDQRHWPSDIVPQPTPPGAALDLLARSVEGGATIVAIGPYTNLALLEVARPGLLARTATVVMGGWLAPPAVGLPAWGPEMDFNVQWDTRAAEIVLAHADLTLAPLAPTLKTHLRAGDLPRLRTSGPLGELLARQAEAHGAEYDMPALGRTHTGLPDDLLNFQYDPVACAVALGWNGVTVEERRLAPLWDGAYLRFKEDRRGQPVRVVTEVDGARFAGRWLAAVEAAQP